VCKQQTSGNKTPSTEIISVRTAVHSDSYCNDVKSDEDNGGGCGGCGGKDSRPKDCDSDNDRNTIIDDSDDLSECLSDDDDLDELPCDVIGPILPSDDIRPLGVIATVEMNDDGDANKCSDELDLDVGSDDATSTGSSSDGDDEAQLGHDTGTALTRGRKYHSLSLASRSSYNDRLKKEPCNRNRIPKEIHGGYDNPLRGINGSQGATAMTGTLEVEDDDDDGIMETVLEAIGSAETLDEKQSRLSEIIAELKLIKHSLFAERLQARAPSMTHSIAAVRMTSYHDVSYSILLRVYDVGIQCFCTYFYSDKNDVL